MSSVPLLLKLEPPSCYEHDMFPNSMYRRQHPHHLPLDISTLSLIARLGAHGPSLADKRTGDLSVLSRKASKGRTAFEVHLDVGLFRPDELSVKLVNDCIVIEGKHEERNEAEGEGYVARNFCRRYELPPGYNADAIVSTLTADGVLTVSLPKPGPQNERAIPIVQTGPYDLFLKKQDHIDAATDHSKPEKQN